jgi:uncharacterized Zn-binding protein involved in type VI secretion
MLPAARFGDLHICPHGPGLVVGPGFPRVLIDRQPAARVNDQATCPGGVGPILRGNPTVLIGGQRAARMTDATGHQGRIGSGCGRVLIGDPPLDASGELLPIPKGCEFLKKRRLVSPPSGDASGFSRHATPAQVGPAAAMPFQFPGDTSPRPAVVRTVTIRGRTIAVVMPADPAARKRLPTVEQIGSALATVSDEQLAGVQEIVLSPNRNPDDPYFADKYNDPNFRSAANAGDNVITFFPQDNPIDNEWADAHMTHETGHIYAEALWKDPAVKARWEAAMSADHWSPSGYADAATEEDFAESCVMYSMSKGTPCEATARRIFPGRYAELDRLFPHGFPRKGAHG